jgi:hypothetical protein
MIEVITMKEDSSMSKKMYSKDTGIGALILEWIPYLVGITLLGTLTGTVTGVILHMLTVTDFKIRWYLASDFAFDSLCICSLVAFAWSLYWGWKRYRLIEREFFASVNDETLTLRFGKDSFPWENIQNADLEGDRRLIIMFLDKGEIKRRLVDLRWLSEKEDLIQSLMDYCTVKKIPYQECEPSSSSRIRLFLDFLIRYPFV